MRYLHGKYDKHSLFSWSTGCQTDCGKSREKGRQDMSKDTQKYLLSLALFGSNGIVASLIELPSSLVVLCRVALGAALLVALVALSRSARQNLQTPRHPKQAALLAASGAALGVAWLFLFDAYSYVGVSVASLLFYCGPVIVMALSPIVFGTRLTASKLAGFAAVVVGAFLVVGQGLGQGISPMGLVLGGMSAVMYAAMVILSKKVTDITGVESSALQLCGAFAAVAVYLGATGATGNPVLPSAAELASLNVPAVLCIGLVNTGFGCYLYFSSMSGLPVTRVAVCGYLEPLSAVVLSAVILGEPMTAANVLGAALILGGAIYSELSEKLVARRQARKLAAA